MAYDYLIHGDSLHYKDIMLVNKDWYSHAPSPQGQIYFVPADRIPAEEYDINSYEHWYYDHGIGAFHFKSDDGRNLYFKYVDVGSFSTKLNTWMWSWDNKSTPKHVAKGLEKVKSYGEENNFKDLSQGLLENGDEYTGWALTAVAAKLLNAIGAYRIPQEHLDILCFYK